jgi:hypothetical protein
MRLSTKRHGYVSAFYYQNPAVPHRYVLNGRTAAGNLVWMFDHILRRRSDLNKTDLKLVSSEKDEVWMLNRKTGGRLYAEKTGRRIVWYDEAPLPTMVNMHEGSYDSNQ